MLLAPKRRALRVWGTEGIRGKGGINGKGGIKGKGGIRGKAGIRISIALLMHSEFIQ
jgi:hypothetical protein